MNKILIQMSEILLKTIKNNLILMIRVIVTDIKEKTCYVCWHKFVVVSPTSTGIIL
jgi:hypothetical protein